MGRAVRAFALVAAATASMAFAPAAAQAPATPDTTVHRFHVDASTLRPGSFTYEMTLERNTATTILGVRTVTASRVTYNALPAWSLLETRVTNGIQSSDTLIADPVTLRPIHWSSIQGQARLGAEFRGDTVWGATSATPGSRSIVTVLPSGTIVSSAMLETELRLLALQAGWEDSTTVLSITLGNTAIVPARLSVIGEDRVRVPAGTFDCWVVAVHADAGRGLYWVTKTDPQVVRSALDVPTLGGAQLVSALSRVAW